MKIETEAQAIEALEAVLAWAREEPDSTAWGGATGETFQRGRVVATRVLPDNTVGLSTYVSPSVAAQQARDMERGYRNWLATLRGGRVTRGRMNRT